MTVKQMANKIRMTPEAINKRLRKHNIYKGHNKEYSHEDFLVVFYDKYSELQFRKRGVIAPSEIKVVEYYLSVKNNTMREISEALEIPTNRVVYIINNFFKEKCVIVESKMNY